MILIKAPPKQVLTIKSCSDTTTGCTDKTTNTADEIGTKIRRFGRTVGLIWKF